MKYPILLIALLILNACEKKDRADTSLGWNGIRASDSCSYAPTNHSGALANQPDQTIAINADPINNPMDQFAVLLCYDAACTQTYKSTSCAPMGSNQSCQTSMPSPHIVLEAKAIRFHKAYEAGFRGYFIHEAVCQ